MKVRVDTRERFFPVDSRRKSVSVAIDVDIQKRKHIVVFFFECKFDVGMFGRQIVAQYGDVFFRAQKNKDVINVSGEKYRHER